MQIRTAFLIALGMTTRLVPAAAQSVQLRLQDDLSAAPIAGAIVRLLGRTGPLAQGLTNELGQLTIRASGSGTYRLRIDRIGWRGLTTAEFSIQDGQSLRMTVGMPSERTYLPTIKVQATSRCARETQGSLLAPELWEEVQKALIANVLTEEARPPLHRREFVRQLTLDRVPVREWVVSSAIIRGPPFGALEPRLLAKQGFIYEQGDGAVFAAPDAVLLLSDEFVSSHCFDATTGDPALVGLRFRPVPGRRVPDVSGTLWVDRASNELRFLEYTYTGLDSWLDGKLGGQVHFRRLAGGEWIVSYWYIRMPMVAQGAEASLSSSQKGGRIIGFEERGGRAEPAVDTLGVVDRALVRGRVYDSLAQQGLAGALVRVLGTADSVLTNSDGAFELAVSAVGEHTIIASHERLGWLRGPVRRSTLLSLGDTTNIEFAVPPLSVFVRALCGDAANRASVLGVATGVGGKPAAGRDVLALWLNEEGAERRTKVARVNDEGLYALCDVPPGQNVIVRLAAGRRVLVESAITALQPGRAIWLELSIPAPTAQEPALGAPKRGGSIGPPA